MRVFTTLLRNAPCTVAEISFARVDDISFFTICRWQQTLSPQQGFAVGMSLLWVQLSPMKAPTGDDVMLRDDRRLLAVAVRAGC